jgi:hypothetical protein
MPPLAEQFKDAKGKIEPKAEDVDHAASAHKEVRTALEDSDVLSDMGVDTILIGSYARHVSIHRMRDVDVFSKLLDAPSEMSPDDLLRTFAEVLANQFGKDRVNAQQRSIKVDFPDLDLSVDAVPARPCESHWEIPAGDGGWHETDPERLGDLTSEMNADNGEHYVPTVKLIRQIRRTHLGDRQPGGFYLEIATYHSFNAGISAEDTPGYLVAALKGVADQLTNAVDTGLEDPALVGGTITTRATGSELRHAAELFSRLARDAREALDGEDACAAAKSYRDMLGKNSDDEWVFPMPSYCNDDGTAKSSTTGLAAGSALIRGGDSRYA